MKICGLQKTTLLDFPGKVAATVFLGGCNFRCPFCHNSDLLTTDAPELLTAEELFAFLRRRAGVLDGVCFSGGEPTLWPEELARLMRSAKELGYQVKLDTNGCRPQVLKELCGQGLVDYVAMDIKAGRWHYAQVCGITPARGRAEPAGDGQPAPAVKPADAGQAIPTAEPAGASQTAPGMWPAGDSHPNPKMEPAGAGHPKPETEPVGIQTDFRMETVEESARWLMEGHVPYEFRTTVVKGLHTERDFADIASWIGGCERYFLQGFVDSGCVLKPGFASFTRAELERFLAIVKKTVPAAEIRGVDY